MIKRIVIVPQYPSSHMKKLFATVVYLLGLVATVSANAFLANARKEICIYSSRESKYTHMHAFHCAGPGQTINLNGTILQPVGNAQYVDRKGYRFSQQRTMNHFS